MKKMAKIVLRYLLTVLAVEAIVAVLLIAISVGQNRFSNVIQELTGGPFAIVPLAVLVAAFLSYFPLTRLFKKRLLGYSLLIILGVLTLGAPIVAIRMGWLDHPASLPSFPAHWSYTPIVSWYTRLPGMSWLDLVSGVVSFVLFASSFWGLSRLSAKRPLWGAFLTPALAFGAIYLYGAFLSGIADAGFKLIGLELGRSWTSAILAGIASLGLILIDFAMCPKTDPGRHDA